MNLNVIEKFFLSEIALINKIPFFFKFNNYDNYFFLTNYFTLITSYNYFFLYNNFKLIKFKENNYKTIVVRNKYFFLKNILKFKKNFRLNLILNNLKFKFNSFFKFAFFFILNSNKKKNIFLNKSFFYSNKIKIKPLLFRKLHKTWEKLVGNLISPHNFLLFSKKKWIRTNKNFNFYSNKSLVRAKNKHKFFLFSKKQLINNFFYLNKSSRSQNYSNKFFFIKNNINYRFLKKNNYDFFLSRPYSFLNNSKNLRNFKKYSNFLSINLYKKYLRFFNFVKRTAIHFRLRNNNSLIFKNFFAYKKVLSKLPRAKFFLTIKPIFSWFSFFNFSSKSCLSLSKKMKKRRSFYILYLFFLLKTKILKKNKFSHVNKYYLTKNRDINKLFRRLKKGNFFFKNLRLIKKFSFINFLNINWMLNTSPLFFKYFFFPKITNLPKSLSRMHFIWKNNFFYFFKNKKNKFRSKFIFRRKFKILTKFKKSFFISRTRLNFVLNNYSFIFINNFYRLSNMRSFSFHNFKKTMFSFSYKNEIQRYILRKYSKITFSMDFNNLQSNKFFFSNSFFYKTPFDSCSYFNFFLEKKNEVFSFLLKNSINRKNWSYFDNQLKFAFNSEKDQINLNIKRIKFKPGYMTLWRDARSVLKTSLILKIKYQYKLTNYLSKYKKFVNFKTFLFMEMRLFNILLKSRLFNDQSLVNLFLKNNLVYLNGINCSNSNLQIFTGDFIQLILNLKYYILYRWFANLAIKKKNKIRNILRKKNKNFNQSDEKKKSYSFPKWVVYSKNIIDDVSHFLEVDYFTLSIFILYEPFNWSDLNSYNLIDQRFGVINLYNWKYIT